MAENIQLFFIFLLLIPFIGLFLSFVLQQNAIMAYTAKIYNQFNNKDLTTFSLHLQIRVI